MSERWTIRSVVKWTADDLAKRGIESARLDAELLVAHALAIDRVGIYMDLDRPLLPSELTRVRELVVRRRKREPIAYILGRREFFGRSFEVGPAVLIPRPETETLVERALELLAPDASGPVLDLCTGSGCIAVTLAAERAGLRVVMTDLSSEALAIAERNARAHAVEARVGAYGGDLFDALGAANEPGVFALITCNPPYISLGEELPPDVIEHEPRLALFGGHDGLAIIRRLAHEVAAWLAPGGSVLVEVGAGQAPTVIELLEQGGLREVRAIRDLGGHDRVIEGRRG